MSDEIQIPQLTLTTSFDELDESGEGAQPSELIILEKKEAVINAGELEKLSDEEKKMVEEFSKQIDLKNSNQILLYGAAAQKNIANFSDSALQSVRTKDTGEVGKMLSDLVVELKNFNSEAGEDKKGGLKGLFSKGKQSVDKIKTSYTSVEKNVDGNAK
jgi:uncharacterized protein YaaN involved in tellurite resistance